MCTSNDTADVCRLCDHGARDITVVYAVLNDRIPCKSEYTAAVVVLGADGCGVNALSCLRIEKTRRRISDTLCASRNTADVSVARYCAVVCAACQSNVCDLGVRASCDTACRSLGGGCTRGYSSVIYAVLDYEVSRGVRILVSKSYDTARRALCRNGSVVGHVLHPRTCARTSDNTTAVIVSVRTGVGGLDASLYGKITDSSIRRMTEKSEVLTRARKLKAADGLAVSVENSREGGVGSCRSSYRRL